ncbi:unnamed protein product [Parnassius apollo]|uniref:(apollo) hypothetical protein n=1 Tax=Parnassius apollo TaxID=110799 RepID=A0A8S3YE25_PARAO|nr:unnamed protein product [Parnassius apollo]
MGCDGGSLQAAFRYAARAGLAMEAQYPYLGKKGVCHYSHSLARVRPRRWATLPSGDEAALERALATIGPLAVAVNAAPITFQLYRFIIVFFFSLFKLPAPRKKLSLLNA